MYYLLVVFSSRQDALAFLDQARSRRLRADIVNTPRSLSLSCGISVRVSPQGEGFILRFAPKYSSYSGTYLFSNKNYTRIN